MVSHECDQLDIEECPERVLGYTRGIPGLVLLARLKQQRRSGGGTGVRPTSASGRPSSSETAVAVKKYALDHRLCKVEEFGEETEFIRQEVSRMKQLRHPNLMTSLASFVSGDASICLVMPHMNMGSVRSLMDRPSSCWETGLPEAACVRILRDVALALAYLHSKAMIHRSVRCSHILLSSEAGGLVKLSGLRYACSLHDPPGQGLQDRYEYPLHVAKTNLNWLSPEMLQQNLMGYNEKSDVYSLGVAACEMANGLVPFSEMPATKMFIEKVRGASPKLLDNSTFEAADENSLRANVMASASNANDTTAAANNSSSLQNDAARGAVGGGGAAAENNGLQQNMMMEADNQIKPSNFATNQPGDSGVGVSVGSFQTSFPTQKQMSANTLEALQTRSSLYADRAFSDVFHEFVDLCSILDANQRPNAKDLLANHSFLAANNKKSSGGHSTTTSLAQLLQATPVQLPVKTMPPSSSSQKAKLEAATDALEQMQTGAAGQVEWEF